MFNTEQEEFWANEFGNEYIDRNIGDDLLASNVHFFSRILGSCTRIETMIEFGSNVGMNLRAIQILAPKIDISAIEINKVACDELKTFLDKENIFNESILDFDLNGKSYDFTLIKGVLIHINPEKLDVVYQKLYHSSRKYILIAEYYNPTPVVLEYRGHENRLFKRDFAGEMMNKFKDLQLVDYGFSYHKDPLFPHDDINWFLLAKN